MRNIYTRAFSTVQHIGICRNNVSRSVFYIFLQYGDQIIEDLKSSYSYSPVFKILLPDDSNSDLFSQGKPISSSHCFVILRVVVTFSSMAKIVSNTIFLALARY